LDQLLTIEIFGQTFTFKTDTDVTDAKAVADYVIKSIDQASAEYVKKMQPPDRRSILILAALNIANEYFELKKKYQHMLQEVGQHSANMLSKLESKTSDQFDL
jgi:cell division protein ZapA